MASRDQDQRGGSKVQISDDQLERSTLRKASWRLLPLIALGYGISYMDRVNISFAAAQMNADLKFSATVYGFGGGLFFLSYALFEVPSNLLLVRFGARRWIARIMLTWGVLAVGMMFVRTPLQFYAMRFLLGVAEAGFFPGVIYYLGAWFPAAHRARAISRFYVAVPLVSVVMGAIAGSLLGLQGRWGLAGWQWLFLVEGLPAVLMSVVFLTCLPDSPATASWLSDTERQWLTGRLASEATAAPAGHNLLKALTGAPILAMAGVNFLLLGSFYAFNLSLPILMDGVTHWGPARVGYLVAAGGVCGAATMLLNGWHSDRTGERDLHLAVPILVMAAAFAIMSQTNAPTIVIAAYLAAAAAMQAVNAVFWLSPGANIDPRFAAAGIAAINSFGQLGSFVLPALWGVARDRTGSFHAGLKALPFAYLIAAAIVLVLARDLRRRRAAA